MDKLSQTNSYESNAFGRGVFANEKGLVWLQEVDRGKDKINLYEQRQTDMPNASKQRHYVCLKPHRYIGFAFFITPK